MSGEPYEDYAGRIEVTGEYQPAKVFVFSDQNARFTISLFDKVVVVGTIHYFVDGEHIEAGVSQGAHDTKVATFISEKTEIAHAGSRSLQ